MLVFYVPIMNCGPFDWFKNTKKLFSYPFLMFKKTINSKNLILNAIFFHMQELVDCINSEWWMSFQATRNIYSSWFHHYIGGQENSDLWVVNHILCKNTPISPPFVVYIGDLIPTLMLTKCFKVVCYTLIATHLLTYLLVYSAHLIFDLSLDDSFTCPSPVCSRQRE